MGLPASWCLPTQRLPFREGDQQARLINGAAGGWLHSVRLQKKPRHAAWGSHGQSSKMGSSRTGRYCGA